MVKPLPLMAKSLFQKSSPDDPPPPPTPYELIGREIGHIKKKGASVRHGEKFQKSTLPWLICLLLGGLGWLYVMDPVIHAWDKGEAVRVYLYLHNYNPGPVADGLVASGIFSPDEVETLNHRTGSFQDYFGSPEAANLKAQAITNYMDSVKLLRAGSYEKLDWLGKIRYHLFVRLDIYLPERWSFLDPSVGG